MQRSGSPSRAASALRTPASFRLEGDVWTIAFGAELDEPWTIGAYQRARREPLNPRSLDPSVWDLQTPGVKPNLTPPLQGG